METALPSIPAVRLRVQGRQGSQFRFAWSTDGTTWQDMQTSMAAISGAYLPPWDRGLRVGLLG